MSLTFDSQDGNRLQIDTKLRQLLKPNLPIFYRKKIIVQCARNKKLNTSENNKDNPLQVSA